MESKPGNKLFDYENNIPEVTLLELPEFHEKSIREVMKYVIKNYGKKYHLPGLDYMEFLLKNPTKVPKEINRKNYEYFFLGAPVHNQNGLESGACLNLDQFGHLQKPGAVRGGWLAMSSCVVLLTFKTEEDGKKK